MHVTAPHSFNMLLQQRAKERRLSVISRKHSTTSAHFARKNWHNAAAQDHVTIQNGHRITTPAHCVHKIRTTPQRETTLRSKIATAPQRQHTLCTKFAPRHNGRPRYDPKWPRATTPAHFVHKIRNGATTGDHVTIQIVTAPHARTQSQRPPRAERIIYFNFSNTRSTLRSQVFLQPRATF